MKLLGNTFLLFVFCNFYSLQAHAQFKMVILDTISYYGVKDTIHSGSHMGIINNKSISILTRNPNMTIGVKRFPNVELYATDSNYNRKLIYKWARTDSMSRLHSWYSHQNIVLTDSFIYFMTENTFFSEIYRTDGTSSGTKKLAKFRHGAPSNYNSNTGNDLDAHANRRLIIIGNRLFFSYVNTSAQPYNHRHRRLHYYDLKTAEMGLGPVFGYSNILFKKRGNEYYFGNNKYGFIYNSPKYYITNGTHKGTYTFSIPGVEEMKSSNFSLFNDKPYYWHYNQMEDSLWLYEYNRVSETDSSFQLIWKGQNPEVSEPFQNALVSSDTNNRKRLTIDNGTVKIDSHNWHFPTNPQFLTDFVKLNNGKYIFTNGTIVHGNEPWVTDLSKKGTHMLIDTEPGSQHASVYQPQSTRNLVLFSNGRSTVYKTDGTRAGTHKMFNGTMQKNRPKFLGQPVMKYFDDNNSYVVHLVQEGLTINGLVFNDENGDGKHDKGEEGVFDQRIQIGPGSISVGTDNLGIISGYVKNQDCTAKLVVPKGWKLTSPNASYSLKKDSLNVIDLVWGIKPDKTLTDFDVDLAVGRSHCTRGKGGIYITNKGNQNITPTVDLKLDPSCTIKSANMAYTVGSDNVVTFKPKNIQSFVNRYISFEYSLSGVQGGDTVTHALLTSFSSVSKSGDIEYVATCSYDPNDKQVSPIPTKGARGVKLNDGDELKYTIRFQNTGNDTAFDVIVYDTLDSKLDFESIRIVGSTHAMTHTRSSDVVKFFFQNIYLPDSTTDEPGSNGHLVFAIKPKAGYAHKTPISNTAGIVFDINKPIITNRVESNLLKSLPVKAATITSATYVSDKKVRVEWEDVAQNVDSLILERSVNDTLNFSPIFETDQVVMFYEDAAVDKANDYYYRLRTFNPYEGAVSNMDTAKFVVGRGSIQNALNIYPNPAETVLTIELPESEDPFGITLIDMTGKIVLAKTANGVSESIDVTQLKSGQYRVRIEGNGKTYTNKIQIK